MFWIKQYMKCLLALSTVFSLCSFYLLYVFNLQNKKAAHYFFFSWYIQIQLLHRGPYANITVTELLVCQKYQRHVAYSLCFGYICLPSYKSQNQTSFDTYCLEQHWKKLALTPATIHRVFPIYVLGDCRRI